MRTLSFIDPSELKLVKKRSIKLRAVPDPSKTAKPFVKWVGGKAKLCDRLHALMPAGVEQRRHIEPFVGGGALFFSRRPERALLCDINAALVNTYNVIKNDVQALVRALKTIAQDHGEERYYHIRERYNTDKKLTRVEHAAMFIYLNKTCFNGLHRVNRKGQFNVPMGRYSDPQIVDVDGLHAASAALKETEILCTDFRDLLRTAQPGDFVYFDPPYAPVSKTANFTAYASDGFGVRDQEELAMVYRALDQRGCKLMLSNSDVPWIRELYRGFDVHTVHVARSINSNAEKRGAVAEVVVCNYLAASVAQIKRSA